MSPIHKQDSGTKGFPDPKTTRSVVSLVHLEPTGPLAGCQAVANRSLYCLASFSTSRTQTRYSRLTTETKITVFLRYRTCRSHLSYPRTCLFVFENFVETIPPLKSRVPLWVARTFQCLAPDWNSKLLAKAVNKNCPQNLQRSETSCRARR